MPAKRKTVKKRNPVKKTAATRKTTAKKAVRKIAKRKITARKTTARKTVKRKTTARKTTTTKRKAAPKRAAPKKLSAQRKGMSKSQMMGYIAEYSGVSKKDVICVFESMETVMHAHLKKGAKGDFTLPGLAKFRVVRKPATKARKGINPFTGEPTIFKAKPARNIVKIRPLKKVKDMAT